MGKLATPFLRTRSQRGCILRPGSPSFIHAFILANAVSDSIKITTTRQKKDWGRSGDLEIHIYMCVSICVCMGACIHLYMSMGMCE